MSARSYVHDRQPEDYCISTAIKGNHELAHWANLIYHKSSTTGVMHHFRQEEDNMNNPNLIYARDDGRGVEEADLYARVVHRRVTKQQAKLASKILDDFGADDDNIPLGNSQNWVVAALGALEREGLVPVDTEEFWKGCIDKKATVIKGKVLKKGRGEWISGPGERDLLENAGGKRDKNAQQVDASYLDNERQGKRVRNPGRIDMRIFEGAL